MPDDPAHNLNPSACKVDFTYTITVKTIKIHDTGRGEKSVADDLEVVLRKIEGWHQGSISEFVISHRDKDRVWHDLSSRRQGS